MISDDYVGNYSFSEYISLSDIKDGDYEFTFYSEGYDVRQTYPTIIGGMNKTIILYLSNSTSTTQIIATLYDTLGNKLPGYYIKTYRRISGIYYNIETSKTNSNGEADFYAILNTPMYYWQITDRDGTLYQQTQETEIYGTTLEFVISLTTPIGHIFDQLGSYLYSLTFNNNTNVWTYTFIDQSTRSTYNKLSVYKAIDGTEIGINGTTATSGTLTIDIGAIYENGSTYIAKATANASPEFEIDSASYTYSTTPLKMGAIGLFMTLIVVVLVSMIGFWNPAVMFIMEAIAIILTWIGGLHQLSYTSMIVIVAILFIFAYVVSDRT